MGGIKILYWHTGIRYIYIYNPPKKYPSDVTNNEGIYGGINVM